MTYTVEPTTIQSMRDILTGYNTTILQAIGVALSLAGIVIVTKKAVITVYKWFIHARDGYYHDKYFYKE